MSEKTRSNVLTIAPGRPFLDLLARGLLAETADDPLRLSDYLVLLPTRRACRALQGAFLRQSDGRALLLPRLAPLGDIDDDELALTAFSEAAASGLAAVADLPPPVSETSRRLTLARMILEMADPSATEDGPMGADQAVLLATELARLVDQVQAEKLSFDSLQALVPEDFAAHWQKTLDLLRHVYETWPKFLEAEGAMDPVARRIRVTETLIALWRTDPPRAPVIAAGSTGSVPVTADLLAAVARLPQGRVVLPGLDRHLDDDAWAALEPSHPQYNLAALLARFELSRADIGDWPVEAAVPPVASPWRLKLISEAMRPAAATANWRSVRLDSEAALSGVTRVVTPGQKEEATVIALALREVLESPGRTAALVTPDRRLARRVAAELRRWDIRVDDSAGQALSDTVPGAFFRHVLRLMADRLAPVAFLAALKHPLALAGYTPAVFRTRVRALERIALRGVRPASSFAGLCDFVDAASRAEGKEGHEALARAELLALIDRLEACYRPLADLFARDDRVPLTRLLTAHIRTAEALAASADEPGAQRLWAGEAGEALNGFLCELLAGAARFGDVAVADYPSLLDGLMAGQRVRPRYGTHPRLFIWGPLEARLQSADRLVLGGLNEGTWPPEPAVDPWMSREMRHQFGLSPVDRRTGLSAHDFAQALAAPEVWLTRAQRVDGAPTVPSRWLMRLDAVLHRDVAEGTPGPVLARWAAPEHVPALAWQAALDAGSGALPGPVSRPAPTPPVAARPRRLSVTRVESWVKDPYVIYARYVLGLEKLDPIDEAPGAAERGRLVHDVLDEFISRCPDTLPADALDMLLALGREKFRASLQRPAVAAYWLPRFEKIAEWFVEYEKTRRERGIRPLVTEVPGRLVLPGPAGDFTLTARADRIDRLPDGRLAILDYKTGQPPTKINVEAGRAPQLPLEALIAAEGGFADLTAAETGALVYLRLNGGNPPGEETAYKLDPPALAAEARDGLLALIRAFDDPATPYFSAPHGEPLTYDGYDHLARWGEWPVDDKSEREAP